MYSQLYPPIIFKMCKLYEIHLLCDKCKQLLSKGMQLGSCAAAEERGSMCESIGSDIKHEYVKEELCGTCHPHGCENLKCGGGGGGGSSATGGGSDGTKGTAETKDATETKT